MTTVLEIDRLLREYRAWLTNKTKQRELGDESG